MGYDDDPREIPDIPEVVNWVEQSVEEGIPWFYFMKSPRESYGLLTFMCCYGTRNPKCPERYIFEKDRILPFIKKILIILQSLQKSTIFRMKWDVLQLMK